MAISRRLRNVFRRSRVSEEVEAELASHLELRMEDNLARGMSAEEARRDALLRFGNRTVTRERVVGEDVALAVGSLWWDLRYALSQLKRNPGFAWTAVSVLALGIGASVALFAFVDAALIRPLPYAKPAQLADVTENLPLFPRANLSLPDYLDWKQRNTVFRSLEVYRGEGFLLSTGSGTEPVHGADVSAGFFRTLGVEPMLGSDFRADADQPQAPRTVLLSYGAWQRHFGGQRDLIGRSIVLDGEPVTVIGVLPQPFHFALRGNAEFWRPLQVLANGPHCYTDRASHCLYGVGRLKEGVSIEQARSEMKAIAANLAVEYPESNRGQGASVLPLSEAIVGKVRPILLTLLGGAALLLVIACVNVSSLLLVRTETRQREIALRSALGASRGRLVRQIVTEAVLLVALSGVFGLAAADAAMHGLLTLVSRDMLTSMPYLQGLGLHPHVLLFAGAVCTASAVLFSAAPSVRLMKSGDLRAGLADGGKGDSGVFWRRFGSNLVAVELTIAMVLLVGAGLLGKSFYRLLHVELGFPPDHLATFDLSLPEKEYATEDRQRVAAREILRRLSALPGVKEVGTATDLAVSGNGDTRWIRFVGRPYSGEHNEVLEREVSAGYLPALGATLRRGRFFSEDDDNTKPKVVMINESFARKYFPGEDPVGKRFGDYQLTPSSIRTVVGVIRDLREGGLDEPIWPAMYVVFSQDPETSMEVLARTRGDAASLLPAMVAAVHGFDPDVATSNTTTMEGRIADSPAAYLHRSSAWLIGGFASLALLLSVIGLYGVISYSVGRRTREIGVRMALGADRGSVARMILKEAGRMIAAGLAAGLVCSFGAALLLRNLLFGTPAWDAPTLALVALALGAAALTASYLPARSAASVNPVEALRAE